MPGGFANDILKSDDGQMEQLQRSCNSLKKTPLRPLGLLIKRPSSSPHLCHRREAIVHSGQILVRLPGITPGPVNAEPPLSCRIFSRYGDLVKVRGEFLITTL